MAIALDTVGIPAEHVAHDGRRSDHLIVAKDYTATEVGRVDREKMFEACSGLMVGHVVLRSNSAEGDRCDRLRQVRCIQLSSAAA
jgi:hypothetical protein